MRVRSAQVLFALTLLVGCETISGVPNGRIRIKNHFWGTSYSTFTVSGGGAYSTLKSGDEVILPAGTTSINFSYPSESGLREYQITCPPEIGRGITIKMIDVHNNRMPGGCETTWSNRSR